MLTSPQDENLVVLCLHKLGEHDHPTLQTSMPAVGNGLILYFRVGDNNLDRIWQTAQQLEGATVEETPNLNPNSGKREFAIRDLDGYYLLISQ